MAGGKTISTVEPRAGNLRVQSSAYGIAVPLIYGRTRVSGNLIYQTDFKAMPHTSTNSGGGKGGSVKQETTTWTYQAAVMMALGEGPINGILSAWRGKKRYSGASVAGKVSRIDDSVTVPSGGVVTVAQASKFIANVQVDDGTGAPPFEGY